MPQEVFPGRFTADPGRESVTVFLIGMRANRWWKFGTVARVAAAMPRMLRHLSTTPEAGMLRERWPGAETWACGTRRMKCRPLGSRWCTTACPSLAWRRPPRMYQWGRAAIPPGSGWGTSDMVPAGQRGETRWYGRQHELLKRTYNQPWKS